MTEKQVSALMGLIRDAMNEVLEVIDGWLESNYGKREESSE